jgi:rhamnogalacturonyl hydrolase YesR
MVHRVAETYPRIEGVPVLEPVRDQILWNECLAHFSPACVAVGVAAGEGKLIELAIHTAHTLRRLNYIPTKKLWVHWGVPGRRCPAIWARGQGWALAGLIGILRHLPDNHPDRPAVVRYVGEIVDGLVATQNAEGLWHNVMDDPRSRVCVRASAMFVYLLAEARRNGWVKAERVDDLLHRGWKGVRGRVWRDKLCCVCCGTGAGATWQHYLSRPMLFYGASAALRAGCSYEIAFGKDD